MRHALKQLRRSLTVLALLLALGVLGGPSLASDTATPTPQKGGTIVVGVDAETPGWDPPDGLIGLSGRIVMGAVYDSLTAPAPDGSFRPNLATSFRSNGYKIWTIKLRRGVRFQDGKPFDAYAVEFHMNRTIHPKAAVGPTLNFIRSVKALDRYTVQVILNQPRADFPLTLSGGLGEVVSPTSVRQRGKDFRMRPVGAGPYRLTEWVRDDHVTLESWSGYFRKDQPYANKIVIRPIPDEGARAAGLRAGNLDVIFTQNPTDIRNFRTDNRVKLREFQYGTTGLYLNTTRPPMNDIRVRRAISYALNRQQLISTVWNGIGVATNSPFPAGSFWANSKIAKPWDRFNLEAARRLVSEYEEATGRKVEFSIISRVSQTEQLYKQALQAQLARAGITVRIEQVTDDNTYVTRLIRGEYEVATRLFGGFLDPVFEITRLYTRNALLNIDRFSTDELERNVQIGIRSQDRAARKRAYDKIQEILKNNVIGIYVRTNTVGIAMKPAINLADWKFADGSRGLGHEYVTMINVDALWRSR
jgi:peptide/nickel transport system substrate-binding protein